MAGDLFAQATAEDCTCGRIQNRGYDVLGEDERRHADGQVFPRNSILDCEDGLFQYRYRCQFLRANPKNTP